MANMRNSQLSFIKSFWFSSYTESFETFTNQEMAITKNDFSGRLNLLLERRRFVMARLFVINLVNVVRYFLEILTEIPARTYVLFFFRANLY